MKNKKILSTVLLFSIVFSIVFIKNTPAAKAVYPVSASIANMLPETSSALSGLSDFVIKYEEKIDRIVTQIITSAAKIAALMVVQSVTQAIIGEGGGGVITDWNKYLYVSPQQRAMTQMNSFFNTVSRGRLSSLNYEGVGPNYDAYLVTQARQAINGQPFSTNLQDIVTDPTQMFAGGNMKGIMTYMQCANNVACYTLTSTAQYNLEYAKAQEIAKNEQSNGFLPVRKNGRITQPASIVSNALTQIDQLGTQVIMNADGKDGDATALAQIAAGAGINIAARSLNYATASEEGQAEIRNKNDEFPFSLGYSLNSGIGISAGGVTIKTGAGAFSGGVQIGNTCASGNFYADINGVYTDIHGTKITCPAGSTSKLTKPTAGFEPPSITCSSNSDCNPGIIPAGTFICNSNSKCARP